MYKTEGKEVSKRRIHRANWWFERMRPLIDKAFMNNPMTQPQEKLLLETISILKSIVPNFTEHEWQTLKGSVVKTSDLLAVKRLVERLEAGAVSGSETEELLSKAVEALRKTHAAGHMIAMKACSKEAMISAREADAISQDVFDQYSRLAMSQTKKGE